MENKKKIWEWEIIGDSIIDGENLSQLTFIDNVTENVHPFHGSLDETEINNNINVFDLRGHFPKPIRDSLMEVLLENKYISSRFSLTSKTVGGTYPAQEYIIFTPKIPLSKIDFSFTYHKDYTLISCEDNPFDQKNNEGGEIINDEDYNGHFIKKTIANVVEPTTVSQSNLPNYVEFKKTKEKGEEEGNGEEHNNGIFYLDIIGNGYEKPISTNTPPHTPFAIQTETDKVYLFYGYDRNGAANQKDKDFLTNISENGGELLDYDITDAVLLNVVYVVLATLKECDFLNSRYEMILVNKNNINAEEEDPNGTIIRFKLKKGAKDYRFQFVPIGNISKPGAEGFKKYFAEYSDNPFGGIAGIESKDNLLTLPRVIPKVKNDKVSFASNNIRTYDFPNYRWWNNRWFPHYSRLWS